MTTIHKTTAAGNGRATGELLDAAPPHNDEAERGLLGALLVDPQQAAAVLDSIDVEHFCQPVNRAVAAAMLADHRQGALPDALLLKAALTDNPYIEAAGGAAAVLHDLIAPGPLAHNVPQYVACLQESLALRRRIDRGARMIQNAHDESAAEGGGKKEKQSSVLIRLARAAELWHDLTGDGWATIDVAGHREHWPLRSRGFRRWLGKRYFDICGGAVGGQAMADALGVIEAQALHDGAEHATALRVAGDDAIIYIDLCDAQWQAIEVTAGGWRVVADPSIRFRRARAMLRLPMPVAGGSVDELREFINVPDLDWPLVVGWLVAALRPRGPYPLLHPSGEAGSGKSTQAQFLRAMVDPNMAPLRSEPREPRDLAIAANNGWIIALDNVSHLPVWLSDALCRLATGGGFATRALYENDEETIFQAMRPSILTGIEIVADRGDLLDRAILINLPTIPDNRRQPESILWARFEEARPRILAALLDAVSCALRRAPDVQFDRLPRMADFAIWATAAELALGLADGALLDSYASSRAQANETAIEASPIGPAVLLLAERHREDGGWSGTASDLVEALANLAGHSAGTPRPQNWPRGARAMAGQVRRLVPDLRACGVAVEFNRAGRARARTIVIRVLEQAGNFASFASLSSAKRENPGKMADAKADANGPADATSSLPSAPPSARTPQKHGDNGMADAKDDADAKMQPRSNSMVRI